VSAHNFRIIMSYGTAKHTHTIITLRTETCTYLQQRTTVLDTAGEELIKVERLKIFNRLLSQMQTSIIIGLLLSSVVAGAGWENLLRLTEFIADIYQQFAHSCIFIINPAAQQKGED